MLQTDSEQPLRRLPSLQGGWLLLIAFVSGAMTVASFAPFSLYLLALSGPALLFLLWLYASPRQAFFLGWAYGSGLLGFGVFWMHISIDKFGNVGTLLAIFITLLFVVSVALLYGLVGWCAGYMAKRYGPVLALVLFFPLIWVVGEWLRGWLFTGFPWLVLGYSQINSPLAGYAPLAGVYGVSWMLLLSAAFLLLLFKGKGYLRAIALAAVLLIWGVAIPLKDVQWTQPAGEPIKVSMIQANIEQEAKWKPENRRATLKLYTDLTRANWESDLIIWPETAVPAFAHLIEESLLQPLSTEAVEQGSELLIGIPVWNPESGQFYNAMISLGAIRDSYYKRHLVPFGEFMPLKFLLRPLIDWLQIPMSDFTPGEKERPLLQVAGYSAGISICYEDVFGEEVIQAMPQAAFLINASNDAWFGDSLAPPQHLEIARMRSLETGRYMLRSTNTGISALIGPQGELLAQSPAFEQHVLSGEIIPMSGSTPYAVVGNWLVVSFALLLLFFTLLHARWRIWKKR